MTTGDLVLISWRDAAFNLDDSPGTVVMETVGWVTDKTQHEVTLASEQQDDAARRCSYRSIPTVCIIQVHQLGITPGLN